MSTMAVRTSGTSEGESEESYTRAAVDRAVVAYYGALSSEELAEQAEWGAVALREFPHGERT